MLVSDYNVHITQEGDRAISYKQDGVSYKVLIPKSNIVAVEIFDRHYEELGSFKNRHYAIAKFIVRDLREEGFVFKASKSNPFIIALTKVKKSWNLFYPKLTKTEELHWLFLELGKVNQKIYYNSLEKEY